MPTSPITLLLQDTENKLIASTAVTMTTQTASLPRRVSSSTTADGQISDCITVIGYKGNDSNIREYSTALDLIKAEGVLKVPKSSNVELTFDQNGKTGFIAHCA